MRNKQAKKFNALKAAVIIFLALLSFLGTKFYNNEQEDTERPFSLTSLNVGQGLSVLIQADGEYMLYDGGGRKASSYTVSYIQNTRQVPSFKYIFISHYDEDHLAGVVGVLNTIKTETVVSPDYAADTKIYESYKEKLGENGAEEIHPYLGQSFSLGGAKIQVIGPVDYTADNENSRSVAVRIAYGSTSFIITGDAEHSEEKDIINSGFNIKSDVYVVGHHGSSSSGSAAFLDAVSPRYAIISVGENSYGHPTQKTLNALESRNIEILRTDEKGEITFYSDGNRLSLEE